MAAHIRFVRQYESYSGTKYDIVYDTRVVSWYQDELPKTVRKYIETGKATCQKSGNGEEIIYEQ